MGSTAAIIAGGAQLGSAIGGSGALESQATFEKFKSDTNARFSEMRADDAIKRGDTEAKQYMQQLDQVLGTEKAKLASKGIDVGGDVGQRLDDQVRLDMALNVNTIKNNAWREAFGYRVEADNERFQGKFNELSLKNQARNTLLTGGLKAIGSFADGIGKMKAPTVDEVDKAGRLDARLVPRDYGRSNA